MDVTANAAGRINQQAKPEVHLQAGSAAIRVRTAGTVVPWMDRMHNDELSMNGDFVQVANIICPKNDLQEINKNKIRSTVDMVVLETHCDALDP